MLIIRTSFSQIQYTPDNKFVIGSVILMRVNTFAPLCLVSFTFINRM